MFFNRSRGIFIIDMKTHLFLPEQRRLFKQQFKASIEQFYIFLIMLLKDNMNMFLAQKTDTLRVLLERFRLFLYKINLVN